MAHEPAGSELRAKAVPIKSRPFRLAVGARPTDDWLLPGPDAAEQMPERRRLLTQNSSEVCRASSSALADCRRLHELVVAEVGQMDSQGSGVQAAGQGDGPVREVEASDQSGGRAGEAEALLIDAAWRIQEDLCLMRSIAGTWVLTAGVVCFPSHWSLADKLGQSMLGIHEPVPGYAERLRVATDQFFHRISGTAGMWERFNWTVTDTERLFTPATCRQPVAGDPAAMWLRTERQVLRPMGEALVFSIRTFRTPLADLTGVEKAALSVALSGVDESLAGYRSMSDALPGVRDWLKESAAC